MKDNRTKLICSKCNSPIITYRKKKKVIYECSYCGIQPDDLNFDDLSPNDWEDDYEEENM
ncbi:hypothetical protein NRS6186_22125 (plasmid) [Bacillus subtilis]|uniref:Uncharacterized protein n=1 Tax=Bacillus subtilis subsp. natto TaxID=86029 RepID=E9RJA9_BACNA|nr:MULTISPECIES: hypothetical protein [Bacillus]MBU8845665.1 hypothetical protein [Alkalicoccobacillus gibsonii]AJO60822.1 hypothetical protein QF06_20390 [Bacillus sp. YP1]AQZ93179.1 hypothetical protein B4U62_22255 [Bacillus subtilis]AXF35619.1 hypothetical protein DS740_22370 [Bacillus sp. DM2]KAA0930129.1 hypothetical protein FQ086_21520 [Bacillus sp. ANT_WA51]